ncbi:MAG: protein-disulfide reductase DsbD [Lysobacter sp.]|nr:protein-disulfide reductase DsbD [Lysobacter sp.]
MPLLLRGPLLHTLFLRSLAACLLSLFFLAPALAIDEKDLLPVDDAFALSASATARDRIEIRWKIADGYYLYRHRISVQSTSAAFKAAALALPGGEKHTDEFFGNVETYRDRLTATLPGVAGAAANAVTLKIKYQGCADLGICYPPQTRTLTVALPGARDMGANDNSVAAPGNILGGNTASSLFGAAPGGRSERLPLPPEQAFAFEAIADGGNQLLLRFTPARGYYLYRDRTTLKLDAGDGIALERPRWPKGQAHRDEHFGQVVVYFDQVEVPVALRRTVIDARNATLTATFQGCQNDGICYPPMTRKVLVSVPAGSISATPSVAGAASAASTGATSAATTIGAETNNQTPIAIDATADDSSLAAEAAPTPRRKSPWGTKSRPASEPTSGVALAEDSRIAASLSGSGRWLALLSFFGFGLLLAFTPCVLPMIPILSGLIAGRGERIGARLAFSLSFVYVLANAVVFTIAGVIAGLLGANLQVAFQTPWVIVAFAALFVALSLSMFGLYELPLPARWRARMGEITDKQSGGSWAGVAAMGALSALIVGPCVAPPLAAAVLYIGQTRDPVFGGAALFLLAMGMGAPLLAFGIAAGRGLPTSGPWMMAVQRVFGFIFVGLAIWMLSRVLPATATLALYGLLALAAAAWLLSLAKPSTGDGVRWTARFAGAVLAVIGIAELFGALAGGRDPLQPLAGVIGEEGESRELEFRMIKSVGDLDREVAAAHAAGKPLLFDFYADWCVSCKEMEKYTFTQPVVHAALDGFVLLKADVTANDEIDQALMQRFNIIGPPATLFFVDGVERRELRLFGYEKAELFAQRVGRAEQ